MSTASGAAALIDVVEAAVSAGKGALSAAGAAVPALGAAADIGIEGVGKVT